MYDYRCEFSVNGELFVVTVTERNRGDAERAAWEDAIEIVNPDARLGLVLRSISVVFRY